MTKAYAEEMACWWGDVMLHLTTSDLWNASALMHLECQTLQCNSCTSYPVLVEKAHEDAGMEMILYHMYKYKVLLCANGKEHWQLDLVQYQKTIGKFQYLYYVPVLKHVA
jgi:hypothetical protein